MNPFADDKEIDFAWKGYVAKDKIRRRGPPRPSAPPRADRNAFEQRMDNAYSRLNDPRKPPRSRGVVAAAATSKALWRLKTRRLC